MPLDLVDLVDLVDLERWNHWFDMDIRITICGYGFMFQVGTFDIIMCHRVILSWAIIRRREVWRGEWHVRDKNGYLYRCVKNSREVEVLRFQSPVVNIL
jgi:hypothetical protein